MEAPKQLSEKKLRKISYWKKLEKAFQEYSNVLVISVDFVSSKQMQEVRMAIRGRGMMIMGKNTIIRKVIRDNLEKNPKLEALLPCIKGNMGFIFTDDDLNKIRKEVMGYKVPAAAKPGVVAPLDVVVPAGPTNLDPGQTSFFQTLNVATKIVKGSIQICEDIRLCQAGEKVTTSAVALLSKLNMKPFSYGIVVDKIYENGDVYDAAVLDLSEQDLIDKFSLAVGKFAAVSFALGEVNEATLPHSFGRTFMLLAALSLTSGYDFAEMEAVKEAMAAGPASTGGETAAAAEEAPEEEEEEEEAAPMDMFGDDEEGEDY